MKHIFTFSQKIVFSILLLACLETNSYAQCTNPNIFTLSGGGLYCTGSSGKTINLSGSQIGVSYQLKLNGVNIGSAVTGTGSSFSFGSFTGIGTYTAVATRIVGGCTSNMSGSPAITADNTPPVVHTKNKTIFLDATGNASITTADINNGSVDNCGISGMSLSKTNFTCADLGSRTVTLTVTDANGNSSTGTATVNTLDGIGPTLVFRNPTVYLDASGHASLTAADVDSGTSDNCSIASLSIDRTDFSCDDLGYQFITFSATDNSANLSTDEPLVTIVDTLRPVVVTQNISVYLDGSGAATIFPEQVDGGSYDNCSIAYFSLDKTSFSCADLGTRTVVLTVTDESGNTNTGTAVVTVTESVPPTAITKNTTVYLDTNGTASATAADIDDGSYDNCSIATRSISKATFTCADLGVNAVTLTVTDHNSNSGSAGANVLVMDTTAPHAKAKNITVYLNASGSVTITPSQVDNGSKDNCGVIDYSLNKTSFTCADKGDNVVTLTVYDVSSNTSTATATVTVLDTVKPIAIAKNITRYLDATGSISIIAAEVDNGSGDNCSATSLSISKSGFTCANKGANNVTLTVTDNSGNSSTATSVVTIMDTTRPVVMTHNYTAYLDGTGNATVAAGDVDNGSTDNCTIVQKSLSKASFNCSNIGSNTVTLFATDNSGNIGSQTAIVTIVDTTKPIVHTQNITRYLNGSGTVSIAGLDVDNNSTDNCAIANRVISKSTFDCSNLGANTVALTVTDNSGNNSTGYATVTIMDTVRPVAHTNNVTVYLNASGTASVTAAAINNNSTDNCDVATLSLSKTNFNCTNKGDNTVILTVTDNSGNAGIGSAIVTVVDTVAPVINPPSSVTVSCNTTPAAAGTATATDNCGGSISITYADASTYSADTTSSYHYNYTITRTWTATDVSGNSTSLDQLITVSVMWVTPTVHQISCSGGTTGSITLSISGGASPLSYSWNTGATTRDLTGATAGTYSVVITDANGCTYSNSWTITTPTPVSISGAVTPPNCNGGSDGTITTSVTGGTSPFSYLWNRGDMGPNLDFVQAGSYSVTVTDAHGCTASKSFTVSNPSAINITGTKTNILCNGAYTGAIFPTASGGTAPYTWLWITGDTTRGLSNVPAGFYWVEATDAKGCSFTQGFTLTEPAAITPVATITNVSCNGGSNGAIALTVTGGTGGYSYTWSTGVHTKNVSGLTAGTYLVSITDGNNCVVTYTYVVTEPAVITATGSVTNVSCHGGNGVIDLTVSGGTTPYTYTWSNGATTQDISAIAGTYSVTVRDANNCTKSASFTITEPPTLTQSATTTAVSCNGGNNGAINLTAAGGTAPYTYSWSNGATTEDISGVTAGNYTATVTDANGCTSIVTYTVTQPAAIALSRTITNASCNGSSNGAIDLTVTGGTAPYTYSWSNGATTQDISGLVAGNYTVTVTDSKGCTASATYTITEPATLALSGSVTNVTCFNGSNGAISLTVTGGTPAYSYSWSNGATTQNISGLIAGTYSVTVTDSKGCVKTASYTVTQPTVITAAATLTNISCNGGSNGTISLTASGGAGSYSYSWNTGATTANISGLSAGNYSVTITDASGCTKTATYTLTQPAAISISGSVVNTGCSGTGTGSVSISVTGGTAPYTYSWSNGATTQNISGISAGTYIVTVTDANGCTKSASYTVTASSATITLSATTTNLICNGASTGAIDLSASGGATPYTYSWSNGATTQDISGVTAGTYTVTVTDAGGCTKSASYTLTQPTAIALTTTIDNVSCNGDNDGSIDITTASGGAGSYYYTWNTGSHKDNITGPAGTYTVTVRDANYCTKTFSYTITEPAAISATAVITNVTCHGTSTGAINITVAGGTAPYSYRWSHGARTEDVTGLNDGTYRVTVTDAHGCSEQFSFTVTEPASLSLSATKTNITCYGGTTGAVNLSVSGGTTPYSYNWSNGAHTQDISTLAAGSYTVTVTDANGCSASTTYTITQPDAIALTPSITNLKCYGDNDGRINLSVRGGNNPYSYSWSNGDTKQDISNLTAGTYSVIVTDNSGCTASASYTVTQPAAIALSAVTTNVTCNGSYNGSINLSVSGGTPSYDYTWNTGSHAQDIYSLGAGSYSVTVTDDNNCSASATYTVTQPTAIAVTGTVTNVTCSGSSTGAVDINVTGGTAPYYYTWSNGAHTQDISSLAAGAYFVLITDANGCTKLAYFTVTSPSAISLSASVTSVSCYGSSTGAVNLSVSGGVSPYSYTWSTGATTQDISSLAAGTYSVTVTDANGCTKTGSYIVTQPSAALAVSGAVTNVSCYQDDDGAVNITVSGGTAPYSYTWNSSGGGHSYHSCSSWWSGWCYYHSSSSCSVHSEDINNIEAGTYSVTVTDASGCTASATFTVTQPTPIAISGTTTNVVCRGASTGAVNIAVSGGTGPYSYTWSNGAHTEDISGVAAGTYLVFVTDANGCTKVAYYTITQPATSVSGSISVSPSTPVSPGGALYTLYVGYGPKSVTLTASASGGTSPYSYSWGSATSTSVTATPTATTAYSVTITDANGCTVTKNQTITVADITCSSNGRKVYVCHGGSLLCVDSSYVAAHLSHGDMLGSCYTGARMTVQSEQELKISVFPNPNSGKFSVIIPSVNGRVDMQVLDMTGKVIDSKTIEDGTKAEQVDFDLKTTAQGLYFIKIIANDHPYLEKIIIQ